MVSAWRSQNKRNLDGARSNIGRYIVWTFCTRLQSVKGMSEDKDLTVYVVCIDALRGLGIL